MHTYFKFLVLIFATTFGASPLPAADRSIDIAIGESLTIELGEFADSVSLSREGIVDVSRGKNKGILVFTGVRSGTSKVQVSLKSAKEQSYFVQVSDPAEFQRRLNTVRAVLNAIPGLRASITGNRVTIQGTIRTRGTLDKIEGIKEQYSGLIVDTTKKNIAKTNAVVTTINRVLSENGIDNAKAKAYGKILVVEGTPSDKSQRELIMRIAKMIQPDIEDRMRGDSSAAPSIRIEVMFVEIQKKDTKNIGLNGAFGSTGPTTGADKAIANANVSGISGGQGRLNWQVGALSAFLKLIQTTSSSRVLSNPQLIARSGIEATFHAGGTFYVSTTQKDNDGFEKVSLHEIKHGIQLGILPKIDQIGQIDAVISTSVSEVASKTKEGQLPELTESSVSTAVTVQDGQSILLSGLVNKRQKKIVERVPLLADIPILGELFKSREFENEETEMLILVTMNKVGGSSGRSEAADQLWEKGRNETEFSLFD